ncbi:MAG: AAA family ATPase [Planctomycetaceae bacterium]|nr:AAA family ATPase [Planctomycetaceae bacterium]
MTTEPDDMTFRVISQDTRISSKIKGWSAYLHRDFWDDWGKYCTQFYLTIVDPDGEHHDIGNVKIGEAGLKPGRGKNLPAQTRKPDIPASFDQLDEEFFSVGQDEDYYAKLGRLGDSIRVRVLTSLNDVAWDAEAWEIAKDEDVMWESLMRSLTELTVKGQFQRMARGDARVTKYDFTYTPPKRLFEEEPPFSLTFSVDPDSPIPTNIHVLIGRNGVGKTFLLSLMIKALIAKDAVAHQSGKFEFKETKRRETFANVVTVSFSAFDDSELFPNRPPSKNSLGFAHIGLRESKARSNKKLVRTKSPSSLAREFIQSLKICQKGARRERWINSICSLQSDPVFKSAQLTDLIDADLSDPENDEEREKALRTFKELSSGHKIVLLTLTRLVEKVEERTLVLIDEPEAHLHPPLLSAMTRALSDLLVQRNGVAIVATHSPIILQEVPKSCVWILNRLYQVSSIERPSIETFAESIGVLTREVFQLELSQSGYHQILRELRQEEPSYEDAVEELDNQLGAEGKAVLRGLFLNDHDE